MSYNISDSSFKVGANAPYVVTGTDVAVADGGTGASSASAARTNLGVAIGTDVQAQDAELQAIAGLASAADNVPYFTGSGTAALAVFTAAGRALVDDADAGAQRGTLGLGSIATQGSNAVNITGGTITATAVINLANPTNPGDAATKAYVDATKEALDIKDSVRVATAQALPGYSRSVNVITASANGALSVDGITMNNNDRMLLKDGAAGADNGIYVVTDKGSAGTPYILTRSVDADLSAEVTGGMYTFVNEGTANADAGFVLTTNDPITLNTTALTFTQFSGAGQITAGNGLTKTGNTIDVVAGNGLTVAADSVSILLDGTTLAASGTGTKVNANGITSTELASASVTAGKIAVGGVSNANQFASGVVDSTALATAAVTAGKIAVGGISNANQFAASVVDSAAIADNAVTSTELASASVITAKIAAGAVTTNEIGNNAVTPAKADLAQTWTHTALLSAQGGLKVKAVITATNYTTLATDVIVGVTDTTAPRTITLIAAATVGNGAVLTIKDQSGAAGTNNITIDGNASENIDGALTKVINTNYGSVTLYCDSNSWFVM